MKFEACRAFYLFHNEYNKFDNTEAQISYDIKIILKSYFRCENVRVLP